MEKFPFSFFTLKSQWSHYILVMFISLSLIYNFAPRYFTGNLHWKVALNIILRIISLILNKYNFTHFQLYFKDQSVTLREKEVKTIMPFEKLKSDHLSTFPFTFFRVLNVHEIMGVWLIVTISNTAQCLNFK